MDETRYQDERKVSETLEVRKFTLIAKVTDAPAAQVIGRLLCTNPLQALLCGLCVMTPEDPWAFAVSKLLSLVEESHSSIEW